MIETSHAECPHLSSPFQVDWHWIPRVLPKVSIFDTQQRPRELLTLLEMLEACTMYIGSVSLMQLKTLMALHCARL